MIGTFAERATISAFASRLIRLSASFQAGLEAGSPGVAILAVRVVKDKSWAAVGSPVSVGFFPTPTSELYTNKGCRALYSTDGGETWRVSKGSDGEGLLRALAVPADGPILAPNSACYKTWRSSSSPGP